MSGAELLSLASATVFLFVAIVAAVHRARSRLAVWLGLQGLGLFAYNALDVVSAVLGDVPWDWLEDSAAALALIPGVHLVLGYIGASRSYRWFLRVFTAYFVGLALVSLGAFANPALAAFTGEGSWAALILAGAGTGYGLSTVLLVRHIRDHEAEERARAQLLLGAVLLAIGGTATDLVAITGSDIPRLSYFGFPVAGLLLAALVLRARFFDQMSSLTLINSGIAAVLAVIAELVVFAWAGQRPAVLVFGTLVVMLALAGALRPVVRTLAEQRSRVRYHATLGRLARQMAHDIRNPLAAIRGAAQFLQEEHKQGRPLEPHINFVELIVERTKRLERVVADYQRIARVEPACTTVDVNDIVQSALEGAHAASDDRIELVTDLEGALPECQADRDLLTHALENVVRNALEAMPEGGTLEATTAVANSPSRDRTKIVIRVRDTGEGMDVRVQESAMDEFFTTKADGSGLGLAFVQRVAQAHGGALELTSSPGQGTTVQIELPVEPRDG
jgi:signal transduction histidine kinase